VAKFTPVLPGLLFLSLLGELCPLPSKEEGGRRSKSAVLSPKEGARHDEGKRRFRDSDAPEQSKYPYRRAAAPRHMRGFHRAPATVPLTRFLVKPNHVSRRVAKSRSNLGSIRPNCVHDFATVRGHRIHRRSDTVDHDHDVDRCGGPVPTLLVFQPNALL